MKWKYEAGLSQEGFDIALAVTGILFLFLRPVLYLTFLSH